jgi:hypothetical protein
MVAILVGQVQEGAINAIALFLLHMISKPQTCYTAGLSYSRNGMADTGQSARHYSPGLLLISGEQGWRRHSARIGSKAPLNFVPAGRMIAQVAGGVASGLYLLNN